MAKKARSSDGINKAQLIRDAFKKLGIEASGKDVQAYTESHGAAVAPAQVSNIRTKIKEGGSTKGRKAGGGASGGVTGEALLQVRDFAAKIGGLERTKELIGILEKLR